MLFELSLFTLSDYLESTGVVTEVNGLVQERNIYYSSGLMIAAKPHARHSVFLPSRRRY